jgi:hypothetical protein
MNIADVNGKTPLDIAAAKYENFLYDLSDCDSPDLVFYDLNLDSSGNSDESDQ